MSGMHPAHTFCGKGKIRALLTAAAVFVSLLPQLRSAPAVMMVTASTWSPAAAAREGAEELAVLIRIAQLQKQNSRVGLVGIGDRFGVFKPGTEEALRFAALNGVAVARRSATGTFVPAGDGLFIDAQAISEARVCAELERCLKRFGAPPKARDPLQPTHKELAAVRRHVRLFQQAFAEASGVSVALK